MNDTRFQTVSFLLGEADLEALAPLWQDHLQGLWQDGGRIVLYLSAALDAEPLKGALAAAGLQDIRQEKVEELDWVARYQATLRPLPLGRRFLIIADGHSKDPENDGPRTPLLLEPGQAFGTGDHDSTAYCLTALEERLAPGDRVLDVGTGSGILAMGAMKLGASYAAGVDIDPLSIQVAGENIRLNGVEVELAVGELKDAPPGPYQVVLANILAEPLMELMPDLADSLVPEGHLILAGIMREKASGVRQAAWDQGLTLVDEGSSREWTGLTFQKPAAR